jgi:hypothetical protein
VSIKEQLKETLGHMTDKNQEYAFLANNAVFGISRYKSGVIDDKTRDLIKQGWELCSFLRRGAEVSHEQPDLSEQVIYTLTKADLTSLLTYEFLSDFLETNKDSVQFTLTVLVDKAREEETFLRGLFDVERHTIVVNAKVEQSQDFFASLGSIFVRLAHAGLRQREESERIRYV